MYPTFACKMQLTPNVAFRPRQIGWISSAAHGSEMRAAPLAALTMMSTERHRGSHM